MNTLVRGWRRRAKRASGTRAVRGELSPALSRPMRPLRKTKKSTYYTTFSALVPKKMAHDHYHFSYNTFMTKKKFHSSNTPIFNPNQRYYFSYNTFITKKKFHSLNTPIFNSNQRFARFASKPKSTLCSLCERIKSTRLCTSRANSGT